MGEHPFNIRQGLETRKNHFDFGFWKLLRDRSRAAFAQESTMPPQELRARIADMIRSSVGMSELPVDGDAEQEYRRLTSCMQNASEALQEFRSSMLVGDMRQRLSFTNELSSSLDPIGLIDLVLHQQGKDREQLRLEARQVLFFGALFRQYEELFGTPEFLDQQLNAFGFLLDGMMFTGESKNLDLYHGVQRSANGPYTPTDVRIPELDALVGKPTPQDRLAGENKVLISMREIRGHNWSPDQPSLYAIAEKRTKSPLTACIKAILKQCRLADIHDIMGMSLAVYHQQGGNELHQLVDLINQNLPISTTGKRVMHPLRGGDGRDPENIHSSKDFHVEKCLVDWNQNLLLEPRFQEYVKAAVNAFYRLQYNRDAFWKRFEQSSGRSLPIELQIKTAGDWVRNNLSGVDTNHELYRIGQLLHEMKGDPERANFFEFMLPRRIYGVDFTDPVIDQALREMRTAAVGLHHKALEGNGNSVKV